MNIFAKFLAPKNKIFYELFEKSADNVQQMGVLLMQVTSESDFDRRQTIISQMEDVAEIENIIWIGKQPLRHRKGYGGMHKHLLQMTDGTDGDTMFNEVL